MIFFSASAASYGRVAASAVTPRYLFKSQVTAKNPNNPLVPNEVFEPNSFSWEVVSKKESEKVLKTTLS